MAHKQKVPSRALAGDLLLILAMRGLEQGDAPHCARRRVSEANRRVAAALRPERCLSRQAGIVRCCLIYYKLLLCQLHHQFSFGGGDGKLEFIL